MYLGRTVWYEELVVCVRLQTVRSIIGAISCKVSQPKHGLYSAGLDVILKWLCNKVM